MSLITVVIYIAWLLSEILLNRMLRSKSSDKAGADRNSLGFIWLTIAVSISLAVFITCRIAAPLANSPMVAYAGLAVIVLGMILRLAAVASLGRFFTVDVTIREEHRLKQDGMYRYLRHPSYAASLLSFIGFGISLNNWISLILVTAAILFAFMMRIRVEEQVLTGQFGQAYLEYKKRTKALIPFVF